MLACRDLPILVLNWKVCPCEMAEHAGHGNGTISPWSTKGVVKLVILDVLITWDITLNSLSVRHMVTAGVMVYSYSLDMTA